MEFTFAQLKKVASPACPGGSFLMDTLPSFAQDPQAKPPEAESQDHRQRDMNLSPPFSFCQALSQVSSGTHPHLTQEAKFPLPHPCPGTPPFPPPSFTAAPTPRTWMQSVFNGQD